MALKGSNHSLQYRKRHEEKSILLTKETSGDAYTAAGTANHMSIHGLRFTSESVYHCRTRLWNVTVVHKDLYSYYPSMHAYSSLSSDFWWHFSFPPMSAKVMPVSFSFFSSPLQVLHPINASLLDTNILFSILFSHTTDLSSFRVKDEVPYLYKYTSISMVWCILIFRPFRKNKESLFTKFLKQSLKWNSRSATQ